VLIGRNPSKEANMKRIEIESPNKIDTRMVDMKVQGD
jgi:hypothetical protein